jgi:hypothetical protein
VALACPGCGAATGEQSFEGNYGFAAVLDVDVLTGALEP